MSQTNLCSRSPPSPSDCGRIPVDSTRRQSMAMGSTRGQWDGLSASRGRQAGRDRGPGGGDGGPSSAAPRLEGRRGSHSRAPHRRGDRSAGGLRAPDAHGAQDPGWPADLPEHVHRCGRATGTRLRLDGLGRQHLHRNPVHGRRLLRRGAGRCLCHGQSEGPGRVQPHGRSGAGERWLPSDRHLAFLYGAAPRRLGVALVPDHTGRPTPHARAVPRPAR